jgi:DNA-binding NtrC family response regulator
VSQRWDTTVRDDVRPAPAKLRPALRVLAVAGVPQRTEPVILSGAVTPIGRAVERGGIELADARVSRLHATIETEPRAGTARIVARSDAPTEVGDQRVTSQELADGSIVFVGSTALLFRWLPVEPPDDDVPTWGLIGDAPSLRTVRRMIHRVGPTDASVLLLGESGTGKELAAHALHEASRRTGPLLAVNCGAIPATLAEAHLFGHVAGSYTGATQSGPGLFRAAAGGTIFLDEIGELPAEIQPKLLRVLEERVVTPVGAVKPTPVDVRVVAATNRDLLDDVEAGRFRGDLYARLSDFGLELPPLRSRPEDVLHLLWRDLGEDAPPLSSELLRALLRYGWPFNVRELKKVAAQLRIVGAGAQRLELSMLGGGLGPSARPAGAPGSTPTARDAGPPAGPDASPPPGIRPTPDRDTLDRLLVEHRGVIADVARATGRSRRTVHRWLQQHGLDLERYRAR